MKNFIINNSLNIIKQNNCYDETKLAEIKYGLVTIYLLISKLLIISLVAIILGMFKEFIIFALIYNVIRMPSFGLHATKSWVCLMSSLILFILMPYIGMSINISVWAKCFLGIVGILFMYKNSPADTHKKPIISKKRRDIYKFISVIITIIYTILSLIIKDFYISNSFIIAIIFQCFIISPLVYKLFKLPYNNYKEYLIKHPELAK